MTPVARRAHAYCWADAPFASMQDLCREYNIPTGSYAVFSEPEPARRYIQEQGAPIVVKAVGLAAGKGVVVAHRLEEALAAVDDMLVQQKFGDAGLPPLLLCSQIAGMALSETCLSLCPHGCAAQKCSSLTTVTLRWTVCLNIKRCAWSWAVCMLRE